MEMPQSKVAQLLSSRTFYLGNLLGLKADMFIALCKPTVCL